MRFLILTQYYDPEAGSPATRLPAIGKELRKLGHDVEVVTTLPNHPTGRIFPGYRRRFYMRELRDGIVVHRTWVFPAVGSGPGRFMNYVSFALSSLIGLLRARKPDFIFVNMPPLTVSIPGMIFSGIRRVPMILHVADIWPDLLSGIGKMEKGAVFKSLESLERLAYRKAGYINAVTEPDLRKLHTEKSVPVNKLLFLPNGVDPDIFKPLSFDHDLASRLGTAGRYTILYAGSIGFMHGADTALQAAEILKEESIHFLFVGGGSDKDRVTRIAGEMGLKNVTFCDPVSPGEIAKYYAISDAGLALFRKTDALKGTIAAKVFPCMGCGKPLIFSGDGATADLIRNAAAGLVAESEEPAELACAIREVARNRDLSTELGQNGRKYVSSHLTWEIIVKEWLREIERSTG